MRDRDGLSVNEASVRVTTKYGPDDYRDAAWPPLHTDSTGIVTYENVYSVDASAHIVVAKSGVELASGNFMLTSGTNHITITCQSLATLTIYAKDGNNQPLQNAQVELNWEGGGVPWTLSQTTDSQGTAVFQQMTFYTYQVQVFWQSIDVHQGTFTFAETSRSYTAQCNVHDLTVKAFDAANKPLSNSKVTVTRSDQWKLSPKYTDGGVVVFPQLAGSDYTISVFYGTYSNTTTIILSSSQTLVIKINFLVTSMYDTVIKVVWSDDKHVAAATVIVQNNEGIVFSGITNGTGMAVVQLMEGTYTLIASKGNATKMQTVNVNDATTITVVFEVAYRISKLIVEVYNQDQTFAYGAVVELYSNSYLVYNLTAVDGTATFSLPDGTYVIVAKLQDKTQQETITLNRDMQLPIIFQTGMNLTMIYSLIAVVTVTVFAIIFIIRRRNRSP